MKALAVRVQPSLGGSLLRPYLSGSLPAFAALAGCEADPALFGICGRELPSRDGSPSSTRRVFADVCDGRKGSCGQQGAITAGSKAGAGTVASSWLDSLTTSSIKIRIADDAGQTATP